METTKGNNMDYDLTKVGPVCSDVPVMVLVRDSMDSVWKGPFALMGIDGDACQCHWVWDDNRYAPECYSYAKQYKEPQNTTRPMNIEEVVQLVKDGAGFKLTPTADVTYFPMVCVESSGKIHIDSGVNCSYIEDVTYLFFDGVENRLVVEVISE